MADVIGLIALVLVLAYSVLILPVVVVRYRRKVYEALEPARKVIEGKIDFQWWDFANIRHHDLSGTYGSRRVKASTLFIVKAAYRYIAIEIDESRIQDSELPSGFSVKEGFLFMESPDQASLVDLFVRQSIEAFKRTNASLFERALSRLNKLAKTLERRAATDTPGRGPPQAGPPAPSDWRTGPSVKPWAT